MTVSVVPAASKDAAVATAETTPSAAAAATTKYALPFPCTDTQKPRMEALFPIPFAGPLFRAMIIDERNEIMVHLLVNMLLLLTPTVYMLFTATSMPVFALCAVTHLFMVYGGFMQRFTLLLHFTEHCGLFAGVFRPLNLLLPIVISPFFGIPSGMYYLHHVVMHHVENNVFPWDLSSTMPYQRNNFGHFLFYWFRFWFACWIELYYYGLRRGRFALVAYAATCTSVYITAIVKLSAINFGATMAAFVVPYCITCFLLMLGNWSQHIFVDPSEPYSNYKLSYNIMNSHENQLNFNDGFHMVHHIHSRLHWTELPDFFLDRLPVFAQNDALLFNDLGFLEVGFLVFTGQWKKLAKAYVHYGQVPRTEEEIIAELKRRCVPIPLESAPLPKTHHAAKSD